MTNRIPEDFIQTVLDKTDIVEVIQQRIHLKKQGQRYSACCPFHDEKSPSFSVHPQKQFYHCFGCGAGGNVIGFLMEYDKLGFRDVMETLAQSLGMTLPNTSSEQNSKTAPLYPITEKIMRFYCQQLTQSQDAIEYLKTKRRLQGVTAKHFQLGFAPDSWNALLNAFSSSDREHLLTVGAIKKKNDRFYDSFRQRIIFPIRDVRGRVVGFGGRSLGSTPPKYLNSPETILFHKNHELYGLYEALQHCKKLTQVVVVEGYMDVVSLHQHGFPFAVATLGTAVNETHIRKLLKYATQITFCFDGDKAGMQASWKAMLASLPLLRDGVCFKVLHLPDQQDPDDLCQSHGAPAFAQLLNAAPELPIALLRQLKQQYPDQNMAAKAAFADAAKGLFNTMPNGIYKDLLFKKLSSTLEIPVHSNTQPPPQPPESTTQKTPPQELSASLEAAAALLIQNPSLYRQHQDEIAPLLDIISQKQPLMRWLAQQLAQHPKVSTASILQLSPPVLSQQVLKLASKPLLIPEDGHCAELLDALHGTVKVYERQLSQTLIRKAQRQPLTAEEKNLLQRLLRSKDKKRIN